MSEAASSKNYRVIIADDDGQLSRRLSDFFKEKNFDAKLVSNGKELKSILKDPAWIPHFIITDLMLPDGNAIEICNMTNTLAHLKDSGIKVLVTSGHNSLQNVKDCMKAGASDYVIKPFKFDDMLSRIVFHIQNRRHIVDADSEDKNALKGGDLYLHLLEIVLKEAVQYKKFQDTLFNLTKMLAITLKAVRCNIVECSEDRQVGWVKASSDDRSVQGIQLDLNRYPEIIHVMNTEKVVVIENLDYDPALAEIKKSFKNISFNSIIVCPLKKRGQFYGVIAARMDKSYAGFNDRDIRFAQMLACVVSLAISGNLPVPLELQRESA